MSQLVQDIRFGFRAISANPGFTAIVVLTLALGIGANSAIFSIVDGVLLRPLPYVQPDELVMVWENDRLRGTVQEWFSGPDFFDLVQPPGPRPYLPARTGKHDRGFDRPDYGSYLYR